ncbi:hypothetical protein A6J66_013735 [Yersinia enterocolitica]|nr:hypothetical protein A6J66_013735 [Yersinia enterocolitica]
MQPRPVPIHNGDIYSSRHLFLYPSSFKLQVCYLLSFSRITYHCMLIGILSFAAFLHHEIYWV